MLRKIGLTCLCAALLPTVGCQPASQADLSQADEEQTSEAAADAPVDAPATAGSQDAGPHFVESQYVLARDVREDSDLCGIRVNDIKLSAPPIPFAGHTEVEISGWIGDKVTMSWPEQPMLLVERGGSKPRLWQLDLVDEPTPRGGVERKYNLPSMRMTGFSLSASLSSIPDGNYRLHAAYAREGGLVICRRGGPFAIRRDT